MKLYLLRHSEAENTSADGGDASRRLTPQGKAAAFRKAEAWKPRLGGVELILTSPYPRAVETAEILAVVLDKLGLIRPDAMFASTSSAEDILRHLRNFTTHGEVLVVGHEPWITGLTSLLVAGFSDSRIRLRAPGLITLDADLLSPRGAELVSVD